MIEIRGGRKEQIVRDWFNRKHEGKVPKAKVLELYEEFELSQPDGDLSYGLFNGVQTLHYTGQARRSIDSSQTTKKVEESTAARLI